MKACAMDGVINVTMLPMHGLFFSTCLPFVYVLLIGWVLIYNILLMLFYLHFCFDYYQSVEIVVGCNNDEGLG